MRTDSRHYFRIADYTEVDGQTLDALRKPQPQFLGRMAKPKLPSMHQHQASSEVCRVRFGMSSDRITAIDTNRSTGNEVRSPRGQVNSGSGKFLRLTPSTGGSPRKNFIVHGHCTDRRRHVRFNPPWRDRIHLNVVRASSMAIDLVSWTIAPFAAL